MSVRTDEWRTMPIFSMLCRDAFMALLEAVEVRMYGVGQPVIRECVTVGATLLAVG